MRKILPILLAATVYLTPLYPVYAQTNGNRVTPLNPKLQTATNPGNLKQVMVAPQAANNMEEVRDKKATKSAALIQKLARFKDKTKANRVENINSNLNSINQRRMNQLQQVLAKISDMLDRVKDKTSEAGNAGIDVTAINSAVTNVETEWAEADVAVKAQLDKDYSIEVNTEATVKTDAMAAKETLRTDLQSVHTQVVEARQALANAISTALSSIKGGNSGSN